jgi:hypothetical protein
MYDPELAAGFQDADLEMAALTEAGNRSASLRKIGLCDHGWLQTKPIVTCNDCGKTMRAVRRA